AAPRMSDPKAKTPPASDREPDAIPLSPAAKHVAELLGEWRRHIAETQTLARLSLSLLKAAIPMADERKAQLGRLIAIEVRALAQLPRLDLWSLRSTTNVRESG